MNRRLLAALFLGLTGMTASPARAARLIAIPFAETVPKARYNLWQFGLYERKSTKDWRSLTRFDLGLEEGVELGVLVISPKEKPPDTWINLQYRPLAEKGLRPALSVGVWDVTRKAPWFANKKIGPSPFVSVSKSVKKDKRYAKAGLTYGSNRLHGLSGGVEVRFLKDTGLFAEYAPRNTRLPGAHEWDAGLYQWLGKYFRVRASWVGGNPMVDVLFTHVLGVN